MSRWRARVPFLAIGLVAAALLGAVVLPSAGSAERQREREAFRNPRVSADGLTLTVDLPGDLQCADQSFDGFEVEIDHNTQMLVVSAWTSRPDPSWCNLACSIYPAEAQDWERTASLSFDQPIRGYTLEEHPQTPLHCSDGLSGPKPDQPLSWRVGR